MEALDDLVALEATAFACCRALFFCSRCLAQFGRFGCYYVPRARSLGAVSLRLSLRSVFFHTRNKFEDIADNGGGQRIQMIIFWNAMAFLVRQNDYHCFSPFALFFSQKTNYSFGIVIIGRWGEQTKIRPNLSSPPIVFRGKQSTSSK